VVGSGLLLLLTIASRVAATTLTYPGAPPCGTTLQACLDGAGEGDRIEIVTTAPIGETLMIEHSVTLTGAPGVTPVIGGTPTPHGMMIIGNAATPSTVVLRGLTISNGGIRVNQFLTPGGDQVLIEGCSISSTSGGSTILVDPDVPVDVRIVGNLLASGGYVIDSLMAQPTGHTTLTIAGNRITAATSGYDGMQIDMRGGGQTTVDVFSNVVHDVTVSTVRMYTVDSVQATVNVVNNTLDHSGAGLTVASVAPASTLALNLFNNIISRMTGAGVTLPASAQLTVTSGFNDLFGNGGADVLNGFSLGAPLYGVDPLFVDAAGADYRLKPGSTLINAGTNVPSGGLPDTDAAGNLRVASGVVDVGAYEFGSTPPTVTTTTVAATTTTTLPCVAERTLPSVACRLQRLAADVGAQVPGGTLRDKLLSALAAADGSVQEASGASTRRARRRALRRAARSLDACRTRLGSRAARGIDASIRRALVDAAVALKRDVKTLARS
jgi:hypothetical protein